MAPYIIIGLIVAVIVAISGQRILASDIPGDVSKKLTPPIILSVVNEQLPNNRGPVTVLHDIIGSTHLYKIKATPQIRVTGERTSDVDVIALINFKGQGIWAKANGNDKFTIKPEEDVTEPILEAEITTGVPPIMLASDEKFFNGQLQQGSRILIRDDGAMIASVIIDTSHSIDNYFFDPSLSSTIDPLVFTCTAEFELECKREFKKSSYLTGCTPNGKRSDCEESIELCGGTAHVEINGKPDCSTKIVNVVDISYEGGEEWPEAGEIVSVSFWKDTTCTRQTSDPWKILALCKQDRLGGGFDLNAGILPP